MAFSCLTAVSCLLGSLLLLNPQVTTSTISTPMTAHRWDYRSDWRPMLHSAADAILQSEQSPVGELQLNLIHEADVRVASTVRYEIEIALNNKGQSTASASFYDQFSWAPLSGLTVHTDLWAGKVGKATSAISGFVRPQLLELPAAESEPAAFPPVAFGGQIAKLSSQAEPLHPDQLPTAMELAMPAHVRLWLADPSSTNLQIVGPESIDTDLVTGDIESVELALPNAEAEGLPHELPRASGIQRLSLKRPLSIDGIGNLVYSEEPLELLVEGDDVAISAAHAATTFPSGPSQLQVSLPGVGSGAGAGAAEAAIGGGWEYELKADPRLEAVRELIGRLADQTGLQPTAITEATAAPVLMLSMAFEAHKARPKLAQRTVRELKQLLDAHGLSYKGLLERNDLVGLARDSGLKQQAEADQVYRIEAVLEGHTDALRKGKPGAESWTILSVAGTPVEEYSREAAKAAAARAARLPHSKQPAGGRGGGRKGKGVVAAWLPDGGAASSALRRASQQLLGWARRLVTAALGGDEAGVELDSTVVRAGLAGLLLLLGLGGGIIAIVVLEILGRRKSRPAAAAAASAPPAAVPAGPPAAPAMGPLSAPVRAKPGGSVHFWPKVKVRRFAEDPAELASRKALWRQILLDAQAYGRARREAMRQEELRRAAAAALRDAMSSSGVTSLDLTALGGGCMHADADAEETEEEEGPPSPVLDLQAEIDALKRDEEFMAARRRSHGR